MNHIYKVVFNKATGTFMAVAEYAKAQGKKASGAKSLVFTPVRFAMTALASAFYLFGGQALAANGTTTSSGTTVPATGDYSMCYFDTASKSVVCGDNTTTVANNGTATQSIALGVGSTVNAYRAVAIGNNTKATHSDSVAIGSNAVTTDANSVSLGNNAGINFTTPTGVTGGNVQIGLNAGSNMTGYANTAVGEQSGSGVKGSLNSALGARAGLNVTGRVNTAIGSEAGSMLSDPNNPNGAERNVGIGFSSGSSLTGSYNTGIGNEAGRSSQGNSNVAIGDRTGRYVEGSYNVAIGREAGGPNSVLGTTTDKIGGVSKSRLTLNIPIIDIEEG